MRNVFLLYVVGFGTMPSLAFVSTDIATTAIISGGKRTFVRSSISTATSPKIKSPSLREMVMDPTVASVLSGSVAGAIGVGVAFPLDTLKTKSQVMRQEQKRDAALPSSDDSAAALAGQQDVTTMNMLQLMALIWQLEGLTGFFAGVRGMMAGQAVIKAMAFSANTFALNFLDQYSDALASVVILISAACFSGFVTSFLVAPIERIKVMMQANSVYVNEFDCLQAVLNNEGWEGLFGRGLGPTLAREIPAYGIYFVTYGSLMQTSVAAVLGPTAPLVFGAISGMACWLPVYPIDVVKTLVQNTEGSCTKSSWDVTKELYEDGGVLAFFDGLTPKMLRAALNHSVTFYIYDLAMRTIQDKAI